MPVYLVVYANNLQGSRTCDRCYNHLARDHGRVKGINNVITGIVRVDNIFPAYDFFFVGSFFFDNQTNFFFFTRSTPSSSPHVELVNSVSDNKFDTEESLPR